MTKKSDNLIQHHKNLNGITIEKMKKVTYALMLVCFFSCQINNNQGSSKEIWSPLWNGHDLTGWHSFLGTPYHVTTDSLGNRIEPFGIDNDPLQVVSILETTQGNAIRISGVAWGMIYTEKEFQNYHLKLKVKWGEDMHSPRENGPRDSGLLYHGNGKPGSPLAYPWMNSQELQIQEGDMGDYWPVGDVEIDIPSVSHNENYFIYQDGAEMRTYYLATILNEAAADSLAKRRVIKKSDAEKPHGEWNDVELIALGDSSIHIVNGEVVMRLYNSRTMNSNSPLNAGKIVLQSEGAEVFYKDLYIRPIQEIPQQFR